MKRKLDPQRNEIESAVARVVKSDELRGANRLKSLLQYIVGEHVEGRGGQILGKTIGMDVYGREPTDTGDAESIVRVDASRLRRRLKDYYAGSGASDPILISVPKGGYAPTFERRTDISTPGLPQLPEFVAAKSAAVMAIALLCVSAALAFVLINNTSDGSPETRATQKPSQELIRLLELSPSAVQARDLAKDGKVLVFPASEAERVKTALAAFETVIELDPTYYGGFAGASQTTAILGGLARTPTEAQERFAQAKDLAEQAFLLNPDAAWSLSAMAWISFLGRDFDTAVQMSAQATDRSQQDPYVHGFDMIISFFAGDFERAVASSSARIHQDHVASQFPWRTAQANALFHLGQYDRALELHEDGIAHGDPPAEINMAHMIASYQASGRTEQARVLAQAFSRAWPGSRLSHLLMRLFQDEDDARAVLSLMTDAGWIDPAKAATVQQDGSN